jgi:glucose 1-dehydrogenase
MKAVAVFPDRREVGMIDQPVPAVSGGSDVKLRMLEVGVCGTDREIVAFEFGTPPPGSPHLVIGHESLGEVVETGRDVTRVRPGDLVVPTVRRPCADASCRPCRAGRSDFCATGTYVERGIKQAHGFLTEWVVENEGYLNVVPSELRPVAVLVEPLTVTEKALIQLLHIQERLPWSCPHSASQGFGHCHRAVVIGAGPVGLLGALALLNLGFETYVYSRDPVDGHKASLVRSVGGHYVSSVEVSPEQLAQQVGPIDLVYEAVGASRIAFDVLRVLGTNGIFVFTGVPGRGQRLELETDVMMRNLVLKNQIIVGTVNASREAFEAAVRDLGVFVARWPEEVPGLITGRFPLDDYHRLLTEHVSGIKNVLVVGGSA